jgi:hypothetical protein
VNDIEARFSGQVAGDQFFMETNWNAPNGRILAVNLQIRRASVGAKSSLPEAMPFYKISHWRAASSAFVTSRMSSRS